MTPDQLFSLLSASATPPLRAWMTLKRHSVLPVLADWLRGLEQPALPGICAPGSPVCGPLAPMYDSMGRRYTVAYRLVAVSEDGGGHVHASNLPGSFAPNRKFPVLFQARDLSTVAEMQKIRTIARNLDPDRLLYPHSDPTLGAPVVWTAPDGDSFVLGGNGRTIALLMADEGRYGQYLRKLDELWGRLPVPRVRPGQRVMLVRDVFNADGSPLSPEDAVQLAGASQESTAAAESPIGRALSTLRGMGLSDPRALPPFSWHYPLNVNTFDQFFERNPMFWAAVLERVDPSKRSAFQGGYHAAELARQIMVGYLPPEVQRGGFEDTRTEDALMAVLPMIVSLHMQVRAGTVKPQWDLLPRMTEGYAVYRLLEKLKPTREQAVGLLAREAAQTTLAETTLGSVSLLAYYLGWALHLASGRKNPEDFVAVLQPYYVAASDDAPGQFGLGFGGATSDPAATLANALNLKYPKPNEIPPGTKKNPGMRRRA